MTRSGVRNCALAALVFGAVLPLMALLILGALRAIPAAHYRAATMDGANAWQQFRRITLPAIAPTMIVRNRKMPVRI